MKTVISLPKELSAGTSAEFTQNLPIIPEHSEVILDGKNLELIDGTGLMALAVFLTHLSESRCRFLVNNLSGQPYKLFSHLGLNGLYCQRKRPKKFNRLAIKLSALIKRTIDIVVSLGMISVGFIPGLIICGLIVADSPGAPLFRQVRVKRHKRQSYRDLRTPTESDTFAMFKFRTMYKDAEKRTGVITAVENDPRVTRIGRFLRRTRLDELPNFINVLIGDMSIVGPRPDRMKILVDSSKNFPLVFERLRFVRPGITGLAQLELKSNGTIPEEKQELIDSLPELDRNKPANEYRFKAYFEAAYVLGMTSFSVFLKREIYIMLKTPIVMFFKSNVI